MHCAATGWLPLLRRLIGEECAALVPDSEEGFEGGIGSLPGGELWSQESVYPAWLEMHHSRAAQAESLVWALRILHLLLVEPLLAPRRRREGLELAECVLTSLLAVRSVQQSHLLQSAHLLEASSLLEKALQQLREGAPPASESSACTTDAEQKFLAACIRTLRSEGLARKMRILGLPLSVATRFAFEQIAGLLCPEQRERAVPLHIQKAATQEEYIRGQMRKNPYVSTEIGPLMRHVREKICSDLNIRDAMEIMELLVGDRIISLDLPIAQVYEQVWVPFVVARRERLAEQAAAERGAAAAAADRVEPASEPQQPMWEIPPMTTVFRLAGVDGEATEDRVETLADAASEAEAAQAERRHGLCRTFGEIGGVAAVVERLEAAVAERGQEGSLEVLDVLLRIAHACGDCASTRQQLVDLGGVRALLAHLLRTIDEMCAQKTAERLSPLETRVAERLLSMVESLARERGALLQQCLRPPCADVGEFSAKDHVSLLLSLLCQTEPSDVTASGGTASGSAAAASGAGNRQAPPQWVQKVRMQVASLLPFLTFGQPAPVEVLVTASMPLPLPPCSTGGASADAAPGQAGREAEAAASDAQPEASSLQRHALSLDLVTAMVEHIPSDPAIGGAIRVAFLRAGAVHEVLRYLEKLLPSLPCDKTSQEWLGACQAPGLPAALRILAGLSAGCREVQRLVTARRGGGLLRLLLQLEGTAVSSLQSSGGPSPEAGAGAAQVGTNAEGLLEALKRDNKAVAREIDSLRNEQRTAKSSRATQSRQKVLRALGMALPTPPEPEPPAAASASGAGSGDWAEEPRPPRTQDHHLSSGSVEELMNFEDVEEDLRCCVCQEGYHFQPEEVLCVYTYVKPVAVAAANIAREASSEAFRVSPRFGLCSVSHFTVIHWHCHQSATRAAANLRPKPQGEWESATVRNSSSKCNALIPVLSPSLPETGAAQALERHFSHLAQVAKGNAQSVLSRRAACVLQDLRLCWARLACQESFSADTGGGGPRHNMCIALVMLQLLCHDALAGESAQELGELERVCVEPLLDFRDPVEAPRALARYRVVGQADGQHPGQLWALCALAAVLGAGTPGGGSSLEWSAATVWRLLVLALEITRQHGPLRWDQRRAGQSPQVRPSTPQLRPQSPGRPAELSPAQASVQMDLAKLPKLMLEPSALEDDPESSTGEFELALLTDAVPMLRFLVLCDVWRWRLERWSRPEGEAEAEAGAERAGEAAGSSCLVAPVVGGEHLGTPLLSRPPLRQRLRRFDGALLEAGEAVAHLFASLTSPTVLWRFFLYRLGDPATPDFCPKLPPHAGANPLELLRPPRLKADPSLVEVAMLPHYVLKAAASGRSLSGDLPQNAPNTSLASGA